MLVWRCYPSWIGEVGEAAVDDRAGLGPPQTHEVAGPYQIRDARGVAKRGQVRMAA